MTMSSRVQVILDEAERESFRERAKAEGLSLSAWLRRAGHERLSARPASPLGNVRALRAFFASCDAREKGQEPDWREHLEVIEKSRRRGSSGAGCRS
jgi:hypothetical protein